MGRHLKRSPIGLKPLSLIAWVLFASTLALGLSGCQKLFTTSLGSGLARTDLPIPATLTPAQAADLEAQAKDNPQLASALTSSLVTQLGAAPDPATDAALMGSAGGAAVIASGASAAVTNMITDYIRTNTPPDAAQLTALLAGVQAGASGAGVITALTYLSDPGMTLADLQASGLGPTDLAIASIVVISSAIPPGTDLSTYSHANLVSDVPAATLAAAEALLTNAQGLAALSGGDPSGLLGFITGAFAL
jgi:hypothetical protein